MNNQTLTELNSRDFFRMKQNQLTSCACWLNHHNNGTQMNMRHSPMCDCQIEPDVHYAVILNDKTKCPFPLVMRGKYLLNWLKATFGTLLRERILMRCSIMSNYENLSY